MDDVFFMLSLPLETKKSLAYLKPAFVNGCKICNANWWFISLTKATGIPTVGWLLKKCIATTHSWSSSEYEIVHSLLNTQVGAKLKLIVDGIEKIRKNIKRQQQKKQTKQNRTLKEKIEKYQSYFVQQKMTT